MNLNTGIIAVSLPYVLHYVCGQVNHSLTLRDVRFMLPECELYAEDILYFTEWPVLMQLGAEPPAYAVCNGGGESAADYFESHGMAGIILEEKNSEIVFGIIQSIFLWYNEQEHHLMQALLRKEPTKELLNCCSEFFQNHAILFDSGLNLIDYSTNYMPDNSNPVWKETLTTRKGAENMFRQTRKMNLQNDPISAQGSELVDLGCGLPRNMISSFYDSSRRTLSLVITENNKHLHTCQLNILDYLTALVGPSLSGRFAGLFSSLENLRAILVMILNKEVVDPRVVSKCLSPWNAEDDYRLILIPFSLPEETRNSETLTRYLYIYENIFPECVAFKYVESLVLIVHNDTEEVMAECLPKLEKQLSMHKAFCGISLPFNDIFQINSQFTNTDIAIRLGDKTKPIRFLKDIFANYLINKVANVIPLIPLCHREAMRIYDYDRRNGTELMLMLEIYLRQNKSLKAAAEELYIHRSTLTYRLGFIERMTKIDFNDSKERLHLLLSCIVLRNLGNERHSR